MQICCGTDPAFKHQQLIGSMQDKAPTRAKVEENMHTKNTGPQRGMPPGGLATTALFAVALTLLTAPAIALFQDANIVNSKSVEYTPMSV